jgi:hypothetical protein
MTERASRFPLLPPVQIQQSALCGTFALRAPKVFQFGFRLHQINVFAKLRRAVKHASLAAHKQRLHLMFPDRRKDLSDRGRDQGCLPSPGIGRRSSRFGENARAESAPATPAIPRASLRTSCSQPNRLSGQAKSNPTTVFGRLKDRCPFHATRLPQRASLAKSPTDHSLTHH